MLQDRQISNQKYDRFIKTVCQNIEVYALKSANGYATSESTLYEDQYGEPISLICFWSEMTLAKSCITEEWTDYEVQTISLNEFIEMVPRYG
jgi:hypothetical protein